MMSHETVTIVQEASGCRERRSRSALPINFVLNEIVYLYQVALQALGKALNLVYFFSQRGNLRPNESKAQELQSAQNQENNKIEQWPPRSQMSGIPEDCEVEPSESAEENADDSHDTEQQHRLL